jgi:hypothetical protein
MNKFAHCFLALAAFIATLEAVSREADPPEPGCPSVAPCATPQLVALPLDGPDSGTDPGAPPDAKMVAASGPVHLVIDAPISLDTVATRQDARYQIRSPVGPPPH